MSVSFQLETTRDFTDFIKDTTGINLRRKKKYNDRDTIVKYTLRFYDWIKELFHKLKRKLKRILRIKQRTRIMIKYG